MRFFNSVRVLYAAVGMLFAILALGHYLDLRNEAMHAEHLQISVELERMVRLDQELTFMLSLSVMERNEQRATRYDTVLQGATASLQKIIDFTKNQGLTLEISALLEGQKKIRAIEAATLQQIRKGRWKEAHDILFRDEYLNARKTYQIEREAIPEIVRGEILAVEKRFGRIRSAALYAIVGTLLLLIWIGILLSRKARADLAEQIRLQQEISTAKDVLEERVRERTDELRLLLHSTGEGIFGVDAGGCITFINPTALDLLGFTEEEVIGKRVHPLIHHSHADGSPYPKETCPMYASYTVASNNRVASEVLWTKDGRFFPVEYASTPILKDGKITGAVVSFTDITGRRQTEKEIQERMDDLERFSRLTIDREEKMIQLKEEINALLEQTGQEKKYRILE